MRHRVEWAPEALNELASIWMRSDSRLREAVTTATEEIDRLLSADPLSQSESRPMGRRIMLLFPLGVNFRIERDGKTITVLRVWSFRRRVR